VTASSTPELRPSAVLWDMDGTILDSEPYWVAAEIELVERFGGHWTHEDGLTLVGQGLVHSAVVLQRAGVDLTVDEIVNSLTDRVITLLDDAVPWRPGAVGMMTAIAEAGIPQALVTMSIDRMARLVAREIPGQPLSIIVAGDHVANPKPDPEAYVLAADRLGVDIHHCLAFEDSNAGIQSAVRSGAVTIGLPNLIDISDSPADEFWESLAERSLPDLISAFARARGGVA
jgi:beta-phosphoglucomutase-like phosphatase (HAD superfamily)